MKIIVLIFVMTSMPFSVFAQNTKALSKAINKSSKSSNAAKVSPPSLVKPKPIELSSEALKNRLKIVQAKMTSPLRQDLNLLPKKTARYNRIITVNGKEIKPQPASARLLYGSHDRGPYGHLKDHPSVANGKEFTDYQKKKIRDTNRLRNGGVLRDDHTGEIIPEPKQYTKGYRPSKNEAQVDHVIPKSLGGSNSFNNAELRSRAENIAKGNRLGYQFGSSPKKGRQIGTESIKRMRSQSKRPNTDSNQSKLKSALNQLR